MSRGFGAFECPSHYSKRTFFHLMKFTAETLWFNNRDAWKCRILQVSLP